MSYVLHGCERSGSCIVELALAQADVDYELRQVSLTDHAQRDADFRTLNPQRKLPALVTPAGETLTETVAIVLTLDERHPTAKLLPALGSPARARALRWMLFVATEIYPIVELNDYPKRFRADGTAAATRRRAQEIWRERWALVETVIAGTPWLLAEGYSIVDAYIATVSRWAQQEAWIAAEAPRVEGIVRALAARPGAGVIWARHFPAAG